MSFQTSENHKIFYEMISEFSAEKFVEDLLKNGENVACDDSEECFNGHTDVPDFYDEGLFKKGQQFFHKNICGNFIATLLGLISVVSVPTILKVLTFTRMSSSDKAAYRRYMATIYHYLVWYDSDFKPGSRLWQSVVDVRRMHNSASKRSCKAGFSRISQKDMALTQFGFIGFIMVRTKAVGCYDATDEELRSFAHIYRVLGWLLGMDDRFNICRDSLEETKAICRVIMERVMVPEAEKREEEFLEMSSFIVNGLWHLVPLTEHKAVLNLYYDILLLGKDDHRPYFELTFGQKYYYTVLMIVLYSLAWTVGRIYHNSLLLLFLWFSKNWPFLANASFGKENARVIISVKDKEA